VCPFTLGGLRPETAHALQQSGLGVEWWQIPRGDEYAYGRMFRQLWTAGRTFVICEHDVAPTPSQLEAILDCGHPWCSYGYDDGLYPDGPMFGLVRFDAAVLEQWPHAADIATIIGKRRDTEAEWWRVDSLVARDLMIRRVPWVQHGPPVRHLHAGPPSGPP